MRQSHELEIAANPVRMDWSGQEATLLLFPNCWLYGHGLRLLWRWGGGFGLLLSRGRLDCLLNCLCGFDGHNYLSFVYKLTRLRKDSFLLRHGDLSWSAPRCTLMSD
jgi:hypothetical protein